MTIEFMDAVLRDLTVIVLILGIFSIVMTIFIVFAYERICRIADLLEGKDE